MSRISDKVKTQRELYLLFLHYSRLNETSETFHYLILSKGLEKQRYLNPRVFVFKFNWASSVLSQLFIDRFREYVRMNRESLSHIVKLIRRDSVFHNKSSNLQTFVENQVLFALYRLEHDDNVSEFLIFAIMWRIFERHLFDCIKRVVEALCRLKNKFVKWSNSKARTRESLQNNERQKDFIEVVGKVDETDIVLNIKSDDKYERELFFNRKKRYVIDLCAACDCSKRFIYFFCEWSNSQHDQRVFFAEDLQKNSTLYFFADQYLLGDSVYINILYLMSQKDMRMRWRKKWLTNKDNIVQSISY
jgi:hypothetical protein